MRSLYLISIGALLIALLDMPYGYYQLLRVGICTVSIILACHAFGGHKSKIGWVFIASALVYNPITPLALGRELWTIVNLATIGVLIWGIVALRRQSPTP